MAYPQPNTVPLFRSRVLTAYWTWLAAELLIPDPWILFGAGIAANPPIEVHTTTTSLIVHAGAFAVLGMLIGWAFQFKSFKVRRQWYWIAVAFGFVTEFIQQWIPKRWPGIDDALADSFGVGIGAMLIYHLYLRHRQSLDSQPEKSYIMEGPFKKSA